MHRRILGTALLLLAFRAGAQPAHDASAGALALALDRLQVTGRVLYVAAHPDDENTAFLTAMSQGRLVATAYLSMTRGDGGQNLIGTEKGELLGLVRTEELLAARRTDGARQLFTRALDFGYSKRADEALRFWGREEVLGDVVRAIRAFRPDVVVTRFPPTGEGGHGHHTASAMLAEEAFTAAGDPARFPEQIREGLAPWKPTRLLWNVFRFGANAPRTPQEGDVSVDLGAYSPLLGASYTEIAARSRTMHKSQGFGVPERRGTFLNDFRPRLGPAPRADLLEGVALGWERVPGGARVGTLLAEARRAFDPAHPERVVPPLLSAYRAMAALSGPDVEEKRAELREVVRAALGLWLDATVPDESATPGSSPVVELTALNRSPLAATLVSVEVTGAPRTPVGEALGSNVSVSKKLTASVPVDAPPSGPFWLREAPLPGRFVVRDPALVNRAEPVPPLEAAFTVAVEGVELLYRVPVLFRRGDPIQGEVVRPFVVAPKVTLDLPAKVLLFPAGAARTVEVTARAWEDGVAGPVRLKAPDGWSVQPASAPLALAKKGDEARLAFTVRPGGPNAEGTLAAEILLATGAVSRGFVRVDYPHIRRQTLFPPASALVRNLAVRTSGGEIGYVMGSGDEVPEVLRQLGYRVTLLSDDELETGDLSRFRALVVGVRAYNTRPRLRQAQPRLLRYVDGGGTMLVQYQTTGELVTSDLGPFPFKLSRERVSVEEAPVTLLLPEHEALRTPNPIGEEDFRGWVQERGLYFAGEWDPRYEALLASHDPDEPDRRGGLLVARHGKGRYVFTGYAFFRQLPAGVPGAIRLFVNLIGG